MKIRWNAAIIHLFVRAGIIFGFGAFIGYLVLSGDILLYLAPSLEIYAEVAAAALLVTAGFQCYIAFLSLKAPVIVCDCGHDHGEDDADGLGHSHAPSRSGWRSAAIYSLFALPLVLGACLPNIALAGSLADQKGMIVGAVSQRGTGGDAKLVEVDGNEDPALKAMFKTDVYNRDYAKLGMLLYKQDVIEMKDEWFIEKLQAMNMFVDNFQGKTIRITGFVYREDSLPDSQFIIGRMAMTHCIADISPYGIITETPDAAKYANDSWITVTGTIDQTQYREGQVIRIIANKIEAAVPASVPYIYPDWNFASKL